MYYASLKRRKKQFKASMNTPRLLWIMAKLDLEIKELCGPDKKTPVAKPWLQHGHKYLPVPVRPDTDVFWAAARWKWLQPSTPHIRSWIYKELRLKSKTDDPLIRQKVRNYIFEKQPGHAVATLPLGCSPLKRRLPYPCCSQHQIEQGEAAAAAPVLRELLQHQIEQREAAAAAPVQKENAAAAPVQKENVPPLLSQKDSPDCSQNQIMSAARGLKRKRHRQD